MGHYSDDRLVVNLEIPGSTADDADITHIPIPANKEVEIYGLEAALGTAAGGACAIELVESDNTAICEVDINTTGISKTATTLPTSYSSTSDTYLKLRVKGAGGTASVVGAVVVHMSYTGAC